MVEFLVDAIGAAIGIMMALIALDLGLDWIARAVAQ